MTISTLKLRQTARQVASGFGRLYRQLRDDRRGMSMIMVGFSLVPVAGAVALAYDTSQAYLIKSRLAAAVDAAALAGGRVYFEDTRDADIQRYFRANFPDKYLRSQIEGPFISDDGEGGNLTVTARATFPTSFVRVLGINEMSVSAAGTTTRETSLLDVVLAIDVSGSMRWDVPGESKSRIDAARESAKELVNILYGDPPSPNLRLGIVPWGGKVRVTDYGSIYGQAPGGGNLPEPPIGSDGTAGTHRYWAVPLGSTFQIPYQRAPYTYSYQEGATWAPDDSAVTKDKIIGTTGGKKPKNIRERNVFGYEHDPVTGQIRVDGLGLGIERLKTTYNKVWYAHNSAVPLLLPPPKDWKGCVYARYAFTGTAATHDTSSSGQIVGRDKERDRDNAADTLDGLVEQHGPDNLAWLGWMPMGGEGEPDTDRCDLRLQQHWGDDCTPCPSSGVYRLQNNKAGAHDVLDTLDAVAGTYTNIPIGMAWAWRVLSPDAPFVEAAANNGQVAQFRRDRAVVLLTDGENTVMAGDAYNTSLSTRTQRDARLELLATRMKDSGVLIYTIQFANGDGDLAALMKRVATSPDEPFYHNAPSSDQLREIFKRVATNLANLRISR